MIHLAWQGLPNYTRDFHITENLPIQLEFLQNLLQHGLKDLTVTGTCLEYGMQEGCLTESLPAKPENPYAIAKHRLQEALTILTDQNQARFKWVQAVLYVWKGTKSKIVIFAAGKSDGGKTGSL
ncbi:MAG: NAD-dependent epimerase/dehydratase family protein [Ferruginibacter sp.]